MGKIDINRHEILEKMGNTQLIQNLQHFIGVTEV